LACHLRGGEININTQPGDPAEVSDDPHYFNSNLVLNPYKIGRHKRAALANPGDGGRIMMLLAYCHVTSLAALQDDI
jgi:hypothetical protein